MSPEKENTFRALKDQPPLATHPIRCWLGWHKWLRWGEPKRQSIYIKQGRYCAACNHYEERRFTE